MKEVLLTEEVPGGWHWSHILKAGTSLQLTDLEGSACAAIVAFNPRDTSERYNMPDTLKAQFTAKLTRGHALYSDMGRVMLSIIEDEVGWHDPLGGLVNDEQLSARFGTRDYQRFRNAFTRSGKSALITEMARYELGERDLTTPVNFFSRVQVGLDGDLKWVAQPTQGKSVLLQAEMDVLVIVAATQHRLDPRTEWAPRPVGLKLMATRIPAEENPAWSHSDQNKRGFHNTAVYQL